MKKRIYIIYTGGTIGMQQTDQGYQPHPDLLQEKMATISTLQDPEMPNYDLHVCSQLIDSADATPQCWNNIAKIIHEHYDNYSGFIVLHGTDTMAYSASALSFMLKNLDKPIIFTGSQVPLANVRNDARENLVNAIYIASQFHIPEVCLYFKNHLFRGNRATKISSTRLQAFASMNFPILSKVSVDIDIREDLLLPTTHGKLSYQTINEANIVWLPIFPGINIDNFANLFKKPTQAIILSTYGSGNAPIHNDKLWQLITAAVKQDIVVINHSQCIDGGVRQLTYGGGHKLQQAGVLSSQDMTIEAVITKLYYLFSCNQDIQHIKKDFCTNLRGEITI